MSGTTSESSVSSASSVSSGSTVSSSLEQIVAPPVEEKKKQVLIDDEHVDMKRVKEWMAEIGKPHGTAELREILTNLHGHLLPAIDALQKMQKHSNVEAKKIIGQYATLAKICEKMIEEMEKSEGVVEFQKTEKPVMEEKKE